MLVKMLIGTGGPNGTACFVGEVYDLPDGLAAQWIAAGRCVAVDGAPRDEDPTPVTHGDLVVTHADPPKRRRR